MVSQPADDEQIRVHEEEREARTITAIRTEATVYATIFEEVKRRLADAPVATTNGVSVYLSPTDLKDIATTIFIQLRRGQRW